MEIKNIQVMRGPNYWSNYRQKLIVMKLDLGKYEELPTNKIPKFYERIMKALPSLYEHRCSEGKAGGLCERMKEGTWLGHVIEHVALEFQVLAGMDCGYGRTRSAGEYGVYKVVFSYLSEEAGIYAGKAAVEFVKAVAEKNNFDVKNVIETLKEIWTDEMPGPSTQTILDEAVRRNIPVTRMDCHSLYMLGYGRNQQLFRATVMGTTNNLAVESAACKWFTKEVLGKAGISVPKGITVYTKPELEEAIEEIPFPWVIKPIDGNHGRGITANIRNKEVALKAAKQAWKISDKIIIEEFIEGFDYRFLVINYKLIAVAKRTPACVRGDGQLTIRQLIAKENENPDRGLGHEKVLTKIKIDYHTKALLKEAGLSLDDVLPLGMEIMLKKTANLSTGGTSTDVTDSVHPFNIFLAERIARLFQLDVCGIDIMAKDVSEPIRKGNGAVIEVNAGPGFRMHTHPSNGTARDVAKPVLDMLFPENSNGKIPIIAITGTNGKTTTTRLIAHMAQKAGKSVGYTTTEGIYINGHTIREGDCSGPQSARTILADPMVDFAVLECARGGILRSGLAFDECDVSIVTNVTEDHLGIDDIHTLEDYAQVKEVVARSTADKGYSILNADDDLVYEMRHAVSSTVVLFSMEQENERITEHCAKGGISVFVQDGYFVVQKGETVIRILAVTRTPVTLGGKAAFMVANVLPSIAAAIVSGFTIEDIRIALTSFIPSPELTPGRMNLFEFAHCQLMLDYAHNASGFDAIQKYMAQVDASSKICIIGATGDRREEDIRNLGKYAASIFNEIIIRHDKDGRGRTNEELTGLVMEGIHSVNANPRVEVISDEAAAIEFAVTNAPQEAFIFVCADHVKHSIELVRRLQEKLLYSMSKVS
ncbi:cyanophycin synthetase [uncultured Fluviicola sp.]|uniref:cyanophycin synthetase n=1 Tax=uncultured Fluviicola sp. TaxID=463303 RepID=UPI0025EFEAB5|nr:cyanophycin synthetase [uncultured Fluviicola sp.]